MPRNSQPFGGDKKVGRSLLSGPENRLKSWAVPRIPRCVETYHLTLTTLLWNLVNFALGFFARQDLRVLWLVSAMNKGFP